MYLKIATGSIGLLGSPSAISSGYSAIILSRDELIEV